MSVSILGTIYNIPTSYFFRGNPAAPVLRVSYPDMKPFSDETKECFDRELEKSMACTSLEIRLASNAPTMRNEDRLDAFLKNPKVIHRTDIHPFDYDLYITGGASARVELYTKPQEKILFYCDIISIEPDIGICQDDVRLGDGNSAKVFFNLDLIGKVADIEGRLRALMASFVVEPVRP